MKKFVLIESIDTLRQKRKHLKLNFCQLITDFKFKLILYFYRRKIKMKIKETRDKNIMKKIKTKLKSLNKVSDINSSNYEKLSFHSPETNTDNQPVPKRNRRKNVR